MKEQRAQGSWDDAMWWIALGPNVEDLDNPKFNAIWDVINKWDIAVPEAYDGYCGATGNHVMAILNAVQQVREEEY